MRTPLRPASRGAFGGANAMRARTRAGLAQRDRVELGRCCDLGVCHRLGAAGGLVLRLWTLWWRAWGDGGCAGWGEDLPSLTAVVGRARDYILVTTGLHLSTAYTAFLTRSPQCDVTAAVQHIFIRVIPNTKASRGRGGRSVSAIGARSRGSAPSRVRPDVPTRRQRTSSPTSIMCLG